MRRFAPRLLTTLSLSFVLACGAQTADTTAPGTDDMSAEEAKDYVDQLRAEAQASLEDPKPVQSMDEVIQVVRADDTRRFYNAAQFTKGKDDVDSLTLRAVMDLARAEAGAIAAGIFSDFAKYTEQRYQKVAEGEENEEMRQLLKDDLRRYRKAETAILILTRPSIVTGRDLAYEAMKKYPDHPRSHMAIAMSHRMEENWGEFDAEMAKLEGAGVQPAFVHYLKGTEALYRQGDRAAAREHFSKALQESPELVRAQAQLVLSQDDIGGMQTELQKLRNLNAEHFVILVAGKAIQAQYEVLMKDQGGTPAATDVAAPAQAQPEGEAPQAAAADQAAGNGAKPDDAAAKPEGETKPQANQ